MKGLSESGKKAIEQAVETSFEMVATQVIGYNPGAGKQIMFASKRPMSTLVDIFVKAMRNKEPNEIERDTLKGLVRTAYNYMSSLKERTKGNVVTAVDDLVRQKSMRQEKISDEEIYSIVNDKMEKAKEDLLKITEASATHTRNMGSAMDILRVSSSLGQKDPYCFFVVRKDQHTCKFCINNHLMPDGVTPRIFKFSEIGHGYLSQDDRKGGQVSTAGQHPHCRCSLTMLQPGFGFENGKVTWKSLQHNEYEIQRKGT